MKRIKLFENFYNRLEDLKDDIEDAFIYFIDNDIIKINLERKEIIFPFYQIPINHETKISKFGAEYRPIKDYRIIDELIESFNKLKIIGLKITYGKVNWVNAGEWNKMGENENKIGTGPGELEKYFTEFSSKNKDLEVTEKGSYNVDQIVDFIKEKGDRLRYIKIYINFI
jgi:hypothetical protein